MTEKRGELIASMIIAIIISSVIIIFASSVKTITIEGTITDLEYHGGYWKVIIVNGTRQEIGDLDNEDMTKTVFGSFEKEQVFNIGDHVKAKWIETIIGNGYMKIEKIEN